MATTMSSSSSSSSRSTLVVGALITIAIIALTTTTTVTATTTHHPSPPVVPSTTTTTTTNLTLHNLCPYPIWPVVTPNAGTPSVPTDAAGQPAGRRLASNGEGLITLTFPPGPWSGRVVARTGCTTDEDDGGGDEDDDATPPSFWCETGDAPPVTVVQVSVSGGAAHTAAAEYSVSLVDGFNVPVVITPHGMPPERGGGGGGRCPTLGCAVDLAGDCPVSARGVGGGCGAGGTMAAAFKKRCPDTRTNATDVEVTQQDCVGPREIKVVFCPKPDSVVAGHL